MKVAIVHDWLTTWAGAEKALAELLVCYPQAEIFTTVNFLPNEKIPCLVGRTIHTSFIQKLPGARKHYRRYLPLMPLAVEQFDLKGFDLVISSSHAVAKGVISDPGAVHVCYCYSPMRYAWDMQHQYLRQSGNAQGPISWLMRWQLHRLRQWDYISAQRVDHFVAISHFIKQRIETFYRRKADVIYPPVEVDKFRYDRPREDFYLTASRMVPYKRIDLVIEAFNKMPAKQLVVIGDGPDYSKLKSLAGPNVTLMGYQSDQVLIDHLERAQAFLFMAEEDFGILPVEAQAAGAPVIGYGVGGLAETTLDNITALWVEEQTSDSLINKVQQFEALKKGDVSAFSPTICRQNAERFATPHFAQAIQSLVKKHLPSS
ncbi:glycosyltransferase family 4 protein [Halovibrio sp. HP20-50]|uniref:glycosyltransferase family 4 protein n=1 Tax=Halovibrio sp. HP20-59 TaxID=3080275 RepID=UPI00294A9DC8|nr:glycosyltransferase family 4 protein [Halovibrio sp. HP20-59]MEA2120105.1 glycosyltransferase family 4 protein [Halovibrio sp. HP20-59]